MAGSQRPLPSVIHVHEDDAKSSKPPTRGVKTQVLIWEWECQQWHSIVMASMAPGVRDCDQGSRIPDKIHFFLPPWALASLSFREPGSSLLQFLTSDPPLPVLSRTPFQPQSLTMRRKPHRKTDMAGSLKHPDSPVQNLDHKQHYPYLPRGWMNEWTSQTPHHGLLLFSLPEAMSFSLDIPLTLSLTSLWCTGDRQTQLALFLYLAPQQYIIYILKVCWWRSVSKSVSTIFPETCAQPHISVTLR